jgi:hypothetical protein
MSTQPHRRRLPSFCAVRGYRARGGGTGEVDPSQLQAAGVNQCIDIPLVFERFGRRKINTSGVRHPIKRLNIAIAST